VCTKSQLSWLNLQHLTMLLAPVTAKQRMVIIPDQPEEGIVQACSTSEVRHTRRSGFWSWDWSQLMVGEEWPMQMIKKAGLWWDHAC